jgi:ketosteroid isomerase-like protein
MSEQHEGIGFQKDESKTVMSRRDLALLPVAGLAAVAGAGSAQAAAQGAGRPGVEARLDIMELLARHSWAYDCGNAEAYAATYTEDGVFEAFGNEVAKGREAVAKSVNSHNQEGPTVVQQHNVLQYVFEGDDASVTVYTYSNLMEFDPATKKYSLGSFSYYRIDCVKVGGQWLVKRRSLNRMDGKTLPWTT